MTIKDTFKKIGEEIKDFIEPHHRDGFMTVNPSMTLQDTIKEIGRLVKDPTSALQYEELPQFDTLIEDWFGTKVDVSKEQFARRLLNVFRESTHSQHYDAELSKWPAEQKVISDFVAGHLSAEDAGMMLLAGSPPAPKIVAKRVVPSPAHITSPVTGNQRSDEEFQNWGRTVKQTPQTTYYPETISEVQAIIRDAVKNGKGVRAAGFRHSWAPLFGRDQKAGQKNNGDVFISTLTEHNAGVLPNFTSLPGNWFQPKATELNQIKVVDASYVNGPVLKGGKKYVRVGTATTLEQFRRWCIGEGNVTLPMNIIEVEITIGGSNGAICHGAGINNPTLSDLVRRIEYVDVHGEQRSIDMSDPDLLKAVSGCFGMIGFVTHITLECIAMCTAVMVPVKLDVIDAVPPPPEMKDSDIPEALRQKRTPEEKRKAQEAFEKRANNDFYSEWFWLPFSNKVWVNTWNVDSNTSNVVNYPSYSKTFLQVIGTIAMNVAQNVFKDIHVLQLCPEAQAAAFSWLAMKNFDEREESNPIRTLVPNALHFQRGVQNIRVRDMEVEMPLQPKPDTTDVRDFTNVQRAWWDAIVLCYANKKTAPQRMPLEMRMMSGSEVTMAPQRGHKLGTCAIEILTLAACADIWNPYAQKVLDKWMTLKDNKGVPLKETMRPHWAKEWHQFEVDGRPWREKLKSTVYKDQIVEFKKLLTAVGKKHDWTLAEIQKTFSNELLDFMYYDDVIATEKAKPAVTQHIVVPKTNTVVSNNELVSNTDNHV